MSLVGWQRLVAGAPWFRGPGAYAIPAYSEFMPPPRLGVRPYGDCDPYPLLTDDPYGWVVTEHEEEAELAPGLALLARELTAAVGHLMSGRPAHGLGHAKLAGNPAWPAELAAFAAGHPALPTIVIAPLALARTQDDKGRVRWTLFGGSEQGAERPFWQGAFMAPGVEAPAAVGRAFLGHLLAAAFGETDPDPGRAGLRILPTDPPVVPLPGWAQALVLGPGADLAAVRYLLTFRPFATLPAEIRAAYLAGRLRLLPSPGSLVFFHAPPYLRLAAELPLAQQIPLLHSCMRHEDPHGLRVPQSGVMHEPHLAGPHLASHGPVRNTFRRTHRWARIHRHEDELGVTAAEDHVAHVLFSVAPEFLGLYGKPMGRNAQIWTHDHHALLDGPRATPAELTHAAEAVRAGGAFGYRFLYPAMRVGHHEVYWHRPLVACLPAGASAPIVLEDAPLGYLTAYDAARPDPAAAVELWPRLLARAHRTHAARLFPRDGRREHATALNLRKLFDGFRLLGGPVPRGLARALLTCAKDLTLEGWLVSVATAPNAELGAALAAEAAGRIAPEPDPAPAPITFARTATRRFEEQYWNTIATLATRFVTKDNADCVTDDATGARLARRRRDLEGLGDHLLGSYRRVLARARVPGAVCGELPFRWQTDFEYPWSDGWRGNREGALEERDLICMIPGRDRRRAVIMADHYDTAYMEDCFDRGRGGTGARLAAAGADDNHSATAALLLAAPVFLALSRAGQLEQDVWLVHLTGEEFPADCLGARHLAGALVEGSLQVRQGGGVPLDRDLAEVRVEGAYVLDMIAHNIERDRDVFQIACGAGRGSLHLARAAEQATAAWNAQLATWNATPARRERGRGRRSPDGRFLPPIAEHPHLHGEVRPPGDPRSALYNTDGQIFSDAGIPVVLFMENYDISRKGYHDTLDTLANIDLDYGAAVAAIAIEAVARVATGAAAV